MADSSFSAEVNQPMFTHFITTKCEQTTIMWLDRCYQAIKHTNHISSVCGNGSCFALCSQCRTAMDNCKIPSLWPHWSLAAQHCSAAWLFYIIVCGIIERLDSPKRHELSFVHKWNVTSTSQNNATLQRRFRICNSLDHCEEFWVIWRTKKITLE